MLCTQRGWSDLCASVCERRSRSHPEAVLPAGSIPFDTPSFLFCGRQTIIRECSRFMLQSCRCSRQQGKFIPCTTQCLCLLCDSFRIFRHGAYPTSSAITMPVMVLPVSLKPYHQIVKLSPENNMRMMKSFSFTSIRC